MAACAYARLLFVNHFAEPRQLARLALTDQRFHRLERRADVGIDLLQQRQPIPRDSCDRVPPISGATIAFDESFLRETIDDASDVGRAIEHACGDVAARMTARMHAAQD